MCVETAPRKINENMFTFKNQYKMLDIYGFWSVVQSIICGISIFHFSIKFLLSN